MRKTPFVTSDQLEKIIQKYPTPFHLYNETGIRDTARRLNAAFSWNEGYQEHYAVKACPNPFIIQLLHEEGCGVDCASLAELKLAEVCGFRGDEIMFSSNETPAGEFEYARKLGAIINLDDITHIPFLEAHGGIPEKICLRFNPGGEFSVSPTCMGTPGTSKFGMTEAQIYEAVEQLSKLGVKRFGLHAFLASNALDNEYYPANARVLFKLAANLHERLGADIFMVNLSGGVGIPYRPEEDMPDIAEIGRRVQKAFQEILVPAGLGNVQIATELGRFMTGPSGCLVATAIHEKHIYKEYIGLDACAANL
ncbi:MAG: diaminopimelate decarboxylase, partial [Clostridia bacterium]|nr:diaminopimelate decarboxylase [Clostridia bacterium]